MNSAQGLGLPQHLGPFLLSAEVKVPALFPMPRARTKSVSPTEVATISQTEVLTTREPLDVDNVVATFLKHGFDPLTELILLYRTGKSTIATKDGQIIEFEMSVSDRVSILKELMAYRYAKSRPANGKGSNAPQYTIVLNK